MDWIERLFHIAPDGGNGSLEVGVVAGAAVALALVIASAIKLSSKVQYWFGRPASPRDRELTPVTRADK